MSVFQRKKTVIFASDGETGAGSHPSGWTEDQWDIECPNHTEAEHRSAMNKLMYFSDEGTPIVDATGVSYDYGDDEFTLVGVYAMGVRAGMLANIHNTANEIDEDIYEITAVDTNTFECANLTFAGTPGNDTVSVVIGGMSFVQETLDETDATDHGVTIYIKDVDVLTASIDVNLGGGNNTKNTFKKIVGFNTSPGDMNYGGTYYESPIEILQNGSIDSTKTVLFDANDGAFELINIDADNIVIENLHLSNNDENTAAVLFSNTPKNIVFRNCRFSHTKHVSISAADSMLFDSCLAIDLSWNHYSPRGSNNVILNCVSDVIAGANWLTVVSIDGTQVIGCLVLNGAQGIRVIGNTIVAMNNTFYDQTLYGINLDNAETGIVFNNIFALNPGAVGLMIAAAGSFIYNDYNCFIESDGTPLTVGDNGSGYEVPVKGKHSVQVDPDFVDAANGDFRVRNPIVLRGGKPVPNGKAAVIGAIDQEYQFAQRARVMNAGRAGIIR